MIRCALLFTLLVSLSPLASAQYWGDPNRRTISTAGESVVYVVPDEITVRAGVVTHDQSLDKAKADNDEASARLLKAVKGLKVVEDRHISTEQLSVGILYAPNSDWKIDGYVARRTYSITLKDAKLLEKLVETLLKNGANQLLGVQFATTELRKHRDAARKMAVKAAKEKAVALAAELDCKLTKPLSINENYWSGYFGLSYAANSQASVPSSEGSTDASQTIPLGQIAVRASVSVTFELAP